MPPRLTKRAPAKAKANNTKSAKAITKLLTHPKSVLATADLYKIFTNPTARDVLTDEEWAEITALFPPAAHPVKEQAGATSKAEESGMTQLTVAALTSDMGFRHACATYTENLAEGKHEAGWLEDAWTAHAQRKAGAFDAHLAAKFEDDWGVAPPPSPSCEGSTSWTRGGSRGSGSGTVAP
ncbi:hypothetical protein JDV02_004894 [Purpureocillium takamizusanense]|uniref:ASX DEUBAD domain-containing protein n=1 Tax=Purpureocillium takamizusanense TaxID=2060973 RepID=A0A9Q8QDB8_9HYPO|nr:uncharacterized protein JDV02_004894 [Purpureocillium takamizusanense]UNI18639.1 hypothetical protein JDV02_004894 [Purpureocillium takamizusanense]